MTNNNCCFCSENNNIKNSSNFSYNEMENVSRIFYQNEYWNYAPTVGGFAEGYILAITKKHYTSLYNTPMNEMNALINDFNYIEKLYKNLYNSYYIFFEHGTVNDPQLSSCSVEHTHIHFIPLNISIWKDLNNIYNIKYFELADLNSLYEVIEKNKIISYLLYGDIDKKIYLIDTSGNIYPSQFLRKYLYNLIYKNNDDGWNWRKHYYINNLYKTLEKISNYNKTN